MSSSPAARTRNALLGLLAVALLVTSAGCAKADDAVSSSATGSVRFPLPSDPAAAIAAAKLPALTKEGNVVHYHAHLDVEVAGEREVVPANIGIAMNGISPLHTHDTSGIIHIEADQADTFTLGQLFTEWGLALDKSCLATYCTDDKNQLLAYRNGEAVADPAALPIDKHAEIYVWYGPKGTTPQPPATFNFTGGL